MITGYQATADAIQQHAQECDTTYKRAQHAIAELAKQRAQFRKEIGTLKPYKALSNFQRESSMGGKMGPIIPYPWSEKARKNAADRAKRRAKAANESRGALTSLNKAIDKAGEEGQKSESEDTGLVQGRDATIHKTFNRLVELEQAHELLKYELLASLEREQHWSALGLELNKNVRASETAVEQAFQKGVRAGKIEQFAARHLSSATLSAEDDAKEGAASIKDVIDNVERGSFGSFTNPTKKAVKSYQADYLRTMRDLHIANCWGCHASLEAEQPNKLTVEFCETCQQVVFCSKACATRWAPMHNASCYLPHIGYTLSSSELKSIPAPLRIAWKQVQSASSTTSRSNDPAAAKAKKTKRQKPSYAGDCPKGTCRAYYLYGYCSRGDGCKWNHDKRVPSKKRKRSGNDNGPGDD